MNMKHFRSGFLSAFDPFKPAPKRKKSAKYPERDVIEGQYRRIPEAETFMHNAFAKALSDVR